MTADSGARPPAALSRRARTSTGRPPAPPRPIAAWLVGVLLGAASRLPLSVLQAVGAALGTVAAWWPGRPRRTTRTNLQLAFPDLNGATRARLARKSLAHTGRTMVELAAVLKWPTPRALAL